MQVEVFGTFSLISFNLPWDKCSQWTTSLVGSDQPLLCCSKKQPWLLCRTRLLTELCVPLLPGCNKGKQCRGAPDPGGTCPAGSPAQTAAGFCPSRLAAGTTGPHQPGWPRWSAGQVSWERGWRGQQEEKQQESEATPHHTLIGWYAL